MENMKVKEDTKVSNLLCTHIHIYLRNQRRPYQKSDRSHFNLVGENQNGCSKCWLGGMKPGPRII